MEKLQWIMAETRRWAQEHVQRDSRRHVVRKQRLLRNLARCNDFLGEGCNDKCHSDEISDDGQRAARIATTRRQKADIQAELADAYRAEQRRFLEDRAIFSDRFYDTCHRGFFDDARAQQLQVPVGELRDAAGNVQTSQAALNRVASAFYGAKGGLFNRGTSRGAESEAQLLSALQRDGKRVPPHLQAMLQPEAVLDPWKVQRAIAGLPSNKAPGPDGFPSEYFKTLCLHNSKDAEGKPVINPFAECLAACYRECLQTGRLLPFMREGVVSLIHKKGCRADLENYRPITVLSASYKILARAMVLAFAEAIPYLVAPLQGGFQREKYIGELTRLVQDLLHYVDETDGEALLVACDQTKAYDLVDHEFMSKVLATMQVPDGFIRLVQCCYASNRVCIKVNGHRGQWFKPTNGVKQGCPLSPLLYICVFQTFLSTLELSDLQGVEVPGTLGDAGRPRTVKAQAFADDLLAFLRSTRELPLFKQLLGVYEDGSGSRNNWSKTEGLLVRGSAVLPGGWNKDHAVLKTAITTLGIVIGACAPVSAQWDKKVRQGVRDKLAEWRSRRVPTTSYGRNLVVKNSAMPKAWYMVPAQMPPGGLDPFLRDLDSEAWSFFEANNYGSGGRGQLSAIKRSVLTQDYAEGGARCLDVENRLNRLGS